jgi:hypothetical protein
MKLHTYFRSSAAYRVRIRKHCVRARRTYPILSLDHANGPATRDTKRAYSRRKEEADSNMRVGDMRVGDMRVCDAW